MDMEGTTSNDKGVISFGLPLMDKGFQIYRNTGPLEKMDYIKFAKIFQLPEIGFGIDYREKIWRVRKINRTKSNGEKICYCAVCRYEGKEVDLDGRRTYEATGIIFDIKSIRPEPKSIYERVLKFTGKNKFNKIGNIQGDSLIAPLLFILNSVTINFLNSGKHKVKSSDLYIKFIELAFSLPIGDIWYTGRDIDELQIPNEQNHSKISLNQLEEIKPIKNIFVDLSLSSSIVRLLNDSETSDSLADDLSIDLLIPSLVEKYLNSLENGIENSLSSFYYEEVSKGLFATLVEKRFENINYKDRIIKLIKNRLEDISYSSQTLENLIQSKLGSKRYTLSSRKVKKNIEAFWRSGITIREKNDFLEKWGTSLNDKIVKRSYDSFSVIDCAEEVKDLIENSKSKIIDEITNSLDESITLHLVKTTDNVEKVQCLYYKTLSAVKLDLQTDYELSTKTDKVNPEDFIIKELNQSWRLEEIVSLFKMQDREKISNYLKTRYSNDWESFDNEILSETQSFINSVKYEKDFEKNILQWANIYFESNDIRYPYNLSLQSKVSHLVLKIENWVSENFSLEEKRLLILSLFLIVILSLIILLISFI